MLTPKYKLQKHEWHSWWKGAASCELVNDVLYDRVPMTVEEWGNTKQPSAENKLLYMKTLFLPYKVKICIKIILQR
jgi:hypothetical protein